MLIKVLANSSLVIKLRLSVVVDNEVVPSRAETVLMTVEVWEDWRNR